MLHLGKVPLFCGLDDRAIQTFARSARQIRVARESVLFSEGELSSTLYVLASGWVRMVKAGPDARPMVIRIAGPSEVVGLSTLVAGSRYSFTAQATLPCTLLVWEKADLTPLIGRYPQVCENALGMMARNLEDLQQQYHELVTERVEQRVAHVLARIAQRYGVVTDEGVQISVPVSQKDLADIVGVTQFTVSRMFRSWRDMQIVGSGRGRIIIRDLRQLLARSTELPGSYMRERSVST